MTNIARRTTTDEEKRIGHRSHDPARSAIPGRFPRHERLNDPQPLHHPDDPLPDRLQHLSADLFARLFLHGFPSIDQRTGELRRAAELSRPAQRSLHLVQLRHHREIRHCLGRRPGDRRLRHRHAAQSRHSAEGPADDAAAAADDAVDGGRGAFLEAALRSLLRHHQLCARARHLRVARRIRIWPSMRLH